jgi:hypothetical protein
MKIAGKTVKKSLRLYLNGRWNDFSLLLTDFLCLRSKNDKEYIKQNSELKNHTRVKSYKSMFLSE